VTSPLLGILASSYLAAPATSYESIATVTVGSGGASNVEFTSIPATYKHLEIRFIGRTTRSDTIDDLFVQVGNGSVDTGSNYASHRLYATGSSVGAGSSTNQTQWNWYNELTAATASASVFGIGVISILDYADTNKYKTGRILGGNDNNGSGYIEYHSGLWRSTSAITNIKFTANNNFVQYTHFALYGIKGA
jgi:hypothetical protein